MAKLEWAQRDIAREARCRHPAGHPEFFDTLHRVTQSAFGVPLECEAWCWEFPMGSLTVGQILDFFAEHEQGWTIAWHVTSWGPEAYIKTGSYEAAEAFRARFGGKWLLTEERTTNRGWSIFGPRY
jgi:hypothetical protein